MSSTLELTCGRATASLYPQAGGRLGQLDFGDGPLLRGPDPGRIWANWGCYPLAPWSNRIPGGRLRFGGLEAELPVNWPDGSAIHGLVAERGWEVLSAGDQSAALEVAASSGPYEIRASQHFELASTHLDLRLEVINAGRVSVPAGIGIHPWFRYGRVMVPAASRWPGEPLPTGAPMPVDGVFDLRSGSVPAEMDTCFTDLTAARIEALGVRLSWDGPVTNVVVYTGEPGWACVEPVTMATGAFGQTVAEGLAAGVQMLDPGESLAVSYRFEPLR